MRRRSARLFSLGAARKPKAAEMEIVEPQLRKRLEEESRKSWGVFIEQHGAALEAFEKGDCTKALYAADAARLFVGLHNYIAVVTGTGTLDTAGNTILADEERNKKAKDVTVLFTNIRSACAGKGKWFLLKHARYNVAAGERRLNEGWEKLRDGDCQAALLAAIDARCSYMNARDWEREGRGFSSAVQSDDAIPQGIAAAEALLTEVQAICTGAGPPRFTPGDPRYRLLEGARARRRQRR